ncbi:hypothetical protein GKC32_04530 [Lactobacillus curvatus]|nr:hypothetical protein [Latilactobacillus curvatus]MSE23741.1 hypothetical protein [Latilactobacillus curvatus]
MSYTKYNRIFYKLINTSLVILVGISLFFSMQSDVLSLDKLSNLFIKFLFFLLLLLFGSILFLKKSHLKSLLIWGHKQESYIFWIFFLFVFLYQLFLLHYLKAFPNFDAGGLLSGINHPKAANISNYLSSNKNNRFIYFFNFFIGHFFGANIKNFQFINILFIMTSVLLLKIIATKLFESTTTGYVAASLFMFYSCIQPLFLVPYTDTYCIPPMLVSILLLLLGFQASKRTHTSCCLLLSGIFFAICYLIRPSAIIFGIAILIFVLVNLKNPQVKQLILFGIPPFLVSMVTILFTFNIFIATQNIIKIDQSKEIPLTHFILLGSYGDPDIKDSLHGTWNQSDVDLTLHQKSKSAMVSADLNAFTKRTKSRGFSKTLKFYLQKYSNITDTGVIGYHRDGLWTKFNYAENDTLIYKVQQIYSDHGAFRPNFNFIIQIVWLFTLFFIFCGLFNTQDWHVSTVSLTLFGGLLFLLIFESGGTKYLFQYIPFICLLSAVGFVQLANKFSKTK